jgi:hypothetical protein
MTYYSDKDYGILHDHCQAIARERDRLQLRVNELESVLQFQYDLVREFYEEYKHKGTK